MVVSKSLMREKKEIVRADFGKFKFSSSPLASKMSASTNQLHFFNQIKFSRLSYNKLSWPQLFCIGESEPRSCVQCIRSARTTSVQIFSYRPPAWLIRAKYSLALPDPRLGILIFTIFLTNTRQDINYKKLSQKANIDRQLGLK